MPAFLLVCFICLLSMLTLCNSKNLPECNVSSLLAQATAPTPDSSQSGSPAGSPDVSSKEAVQPTEAITPAETIQPKEAVTPRESVQPTAP